MTDDQTPIFEMQAELCRAMSNATRVELIHLLREGPKQIGLLAEATGLSQGTISRHLATLRNARMVISQRKNNEVYYQIANPKIVSVCDLMRQVLSEQAHLHADMLGDFE